MANPFEKHLTKEDLLQRAVVNYLRLQYPKAFFCHTPNEGKRTKFEQFKAKTLGMVSGIPDLMIYNPKPHKGHVDGYAAYEFSGLAIELKIKPNKPTANQIEALEKLKNCGWSTHVCYSFDETQKVIDDYFKNLKNHFLLMK